MRKYSVLTILAAVAAMAMIAVAVPSNGQTATTEVSEVSGGAFGLQGEISSDLVVLPSPAQIEALVTAAVDDDAAAAAQAVAGLPESAGDAEAVIAAVTPTPEVTLPSAGGGPFTDSVASIVAEGETITGLAEVSTEGSLGPSGAVASSADLAEYDLFLLGGEAVSSECTADLDGTEGSTTLVNAGDILSGLYPTNPEPNTESPTNFDIQLVVDQMTGATLYASYVTLLNEQVTEGTELTVNAMHTLLHIGIDEDGPAGPDPEQVILDADVTASQSRCGVVEAEIVEPEPEPEEPEAPDAAPDVVVATPPFTG